MLRVEQLSPTAQDVLRWLSCQTSVDHELLAEVTGVDSDALLDALREATASHILEASAEGTYAYRHALLREVVHDDLLPGERTRFHGVFARALEDRIEGGNTGAHITAQAAHHWMAAGDQSAALAAAVRAGEAAERVDAYAEAHALFERALGLWDRVDDPEALAGSGRRDLLMRAANAADLGHEMGRFEALVKSALEMVDAESEPQEAASMLPSCTARSGSSAGRTSRSRRSTGRSRCSTPARTPASAPSCWHASRAPGCCRAGTATPSRPGARRSPWPARLATATRRCWP